MSGRGFNVLVLLVYLLTVPAGVFFYFTSPRMGFPKGTAGIIAGILAVSGFAMLPWVLGKKSAPATAGQPLSTQAGWSILLGFLLIMAGVVAYFTLREP